MILGKHQLQIFMKGAQCYQIYPINLSHIQKYVFYKSFEVHLTLVTILLLASTNPLLSKQIKTMHYHIILSCWEFDQVHVALAH